MSSQNIWGGGFAHWEQNPPLQMAAARKDAAEKAAADQCKRWVPTASFA